MIIGKVLLAQITDKNVRNFTLTDNICACKVIPLVTLVTTYPGTTIGRV